eukprot:scaffold21607_cov111-Amphora_coffeaeformis.AAC.1
MTGTNDAQEEVPEPEPIQHEQTHQYATRSRGVHNIDVNQMNNPRVERELRLLDTHYNPTISTHDDDEPPEAAEIALLLVLSGGRDPLTFEEAWNNPDPTERKGWRSGIMKEFMDM